MFCILKIKKIRSVSPVEQLACCVWALSHYADPFTPHPRYGATGARPALSQVMSLLEG